MKKQISLAALAVALFSIMACNKNETQIAQPLSVVTVKNLPADTTTGFSATGRPIGANKYTYISLREGKVIEGADTLTNKWDIAFKQFYIKLNGGTSATGGGNAAAFIANSTFEAYTNITEPETTFVQDAGAVFAISPQPGGWYTYSTTTFLALPTPGKVFVIRTADGKYAKMEITSFYRNGITPEVSASLIEKALSQFFYQFRYVFQPNGSKQFQ